VLAADLADTRPLKTGVMRPLENLLVFERNRIFILLLVSTWLFACDFNANTNIRSGTLEDDYVEEPLSSLAQRFENALYTSNSLVDHLDSNKIDAIYRNIFSDELRANISLKDFKELVGKIKSVKGEVVSYKKMQWGFTNIIEERRNLIGSTKIVEHEKGMMKYLLVFNNDGNFDRIVGFHFKEREGASPPGQF